MILRVGVRSLLAAESFDDVDEAPVVLDPPLSTASLLLFLLPGLNLYRERTELVTDQIPNINIDSIP